MLLVSACLAGLNTRYDATDCCDDHLKSLLAQGRVIPVCPEQLGGLPTPREPMEIVGGDGKALLEGKARAIGRSSGRDFTENLIRGAEEVLKIVTLLKPELVVFKDGSPSCGCSYIKSNNKRVSGVGVTTAALLKKGLKVQSSF